MEVEKDSEETEETIVGEGEDNLISHEAKNTGESNVIARGYVHYDDPVAWELTADGTLTISPTSAIPAYHMEDLNSWTCWYEHGIGVGDGVDFTQNIKKLVIENGVTRILNEEFKDHIQLTDVSIADTITYIGQDAFRGCTSLRSFPALPNISCVQKRAFQGCVSLKEFTVVTGMIEERAFDGCTNLTTVTLNEGVDAIGIAAFSNCPKLSSILIPDSLITIHYWAFNGDTNLTSITFGKGITSLGENLFNGSGLQTVTFTGPGTDALFDRLAFNEITANVYYPDDGTWDNKIGDYGGHLTWIPTASTVCSVTHGDHVRGDPVRENDKEPTYTTAGSYDEVVYCSACGKELSRDNKMYGKPNKLPAPVLSSVSNVNGGVQVKWGKVTGATSYNVYRKASGESSWTVIKNGVTALGFTDKSVKSGTKYAYTVKAVVKEGGQSAASSAAASKAVTYIAAPVISSIGKDNAGVKIKWAKVAGAAQYRVYRKTGSGNWAKLGDTTAVSWTDKKTQNGTTYSYTVRCLSADGKSYTSSYDKAGKTITPVANPAVPTLTLNVKGVKVAWSKVAGATRYRVYRKAGNGNWTKVKDTTSLSCLDTGVTSNTQYSYTIRCLSDDGKLYTSGYSTTGKTIKYIAAPGVPTLTATTGKVTVKWAKVAGAAKYRVLRKTGNGSWEKLGDTTGLTWTDDTVKSGTLYTYTIRCISLIGNSYTSAYNTTGSTIKAK